MKLTATGWLVIAALPFAAAAQEDEAPRPFIYSTYFECDVTGQERADELVENNWKGIYDRAVKDGEIGSWGWLGHHTGGKWRRASYYTAPSIEALLAAGDAIGDRLQERAGDSPEFGRICNTHEDYIWRSVAGSGSAARSTARGKVGMSTYHVCHMSSESRADEIVKSVIGPVFDDHTGKGKLSSWGWSQHVVGGKYRRLGTMTASDWETLFAMREAVFTALDGNELADEFNEICTSHSDYLWDIQFENP